MNHPIAQFVALTCYANAALRARTVPAFSPGNSTCRFCDSVEFVGPRHDRLATGLLDACQSAWVFGGMGSWNDLAFEGPAQAEYEQVSKRMFLTVCDVIQAAANASALLT